MKPPNRRVSLPENPVNFLKVILSDDTRSTGIRMPKNFAEKHGKNLLERVTLKLPNGDVWRVDLEKSNGEIWLENGWWEFAEHYGLKYGHLLMFKYEGFSIFSVIIFDITASEIVYPTMIIDQLKNPTKEVPRNSQIETVNLEDETCSSSEDENPGVKINVGGECSRMGLKDKRKTFERAKATFKSNKPYFVTYIKKSYLIKKRGLRVPMEFWRKYFGVHNTHSKYLLKLANDERQKTWEVLENNNYLRHGDWLMFVKENGITEGDICAFELIHKHRNVIDVTILSSST